MVLGGEHSLTIGAIKPFLRRYPNLVLLRTFSKVYGLAGMRMGYAVAAQLARDLQLTMRAFSSAVYVVGAVNRDAGKQQVATTMAFVRLLKELMRDKEFGKRVVPIIPDEARTFGMEGLFRQVGIYSHVGQNYEPVDSDQLAFYKEAKDGQILEEGITEAGSMASFIAAGSAYATHGINTIPFFIYYSMFGFQRIADFIWAAADARCRGFARRSSTTLPEPACRAIGSSP